MASNWSDLPNELLTLTTDKLKSIKDYIRFGATCSRWHSIFSKNGDRLPPQPPFLMIPSKHIYQQHSFYSISDRRLYNFKSQVPRAKLHCCGSSFGWLILVDESLKVHLYNPFSSINNEIHLPSLTSLIITVPLVSSFMFPTDVHKAILSANPASTPDYVVMIIYGGFTRFGVFSRLGFFKAGQKTWTSINFKWHGFKDVIHYKGLFYAVQHMGAVAVCDLTSSSPKVTKLPIASSWQREYLLQKKYLVELSGELLLVIKELQKEDLNLRIATLGFQVFRLDTILWNWAETRSLSGFSLFLSDNSSISVLASDFPGCKPNRIYYTEDICETLILLQALKDLDVGVFNLEDGSIEPHYQKNYPMLTAPPIWVQPTLQGCK